MLKKNETIEILKNGGHIMIDIIYRRATVYNAAGDNLGVCRYDTAERIERMEGYKTRKTDWFATRFVELDWDAISARVLDSVTKTFQAMEKSGVISDLEIETISTAEPLTADFGVRACVTEIERMIERGETAETIAADLIECECEQGAFFNKKMWTAFDAIFPDFPVSRECMAFYWNECKHDADRRAHVRRLISTHVTQATQEAAATVEEIQTPNEAAVAAYVAEEARKIDADLAQGMTRAEVVEEIHEHVWTQDEATNEAILAGLYGVFPWLEQPKQAAARVAVRDPETEEILEGSPRAIYHAIAYRVRYARRYYENSPEWEPVTENAARIIEAAHAVTRGPARAAVLARATIRGYKNHRTQQRTQAAAVALAWHRAGDLVTVARYVDGQTAKYTTIRGAAPTRTQDRDENRDYCKRVADELEAYAAGDVRRCPNCDREHVRPWDEVGDVFRCPHCGDVADVDDWEQLGIYDYMSDVLDYDFRIDSQREFSGIRVFVTLGGPSCWIDTERRTVEIRWGGESACYGLLSDTVEAVEEWGRELWEMGC